MVAHVALLLFRKASHLRAFWRVYLQQNRIRRCDCRNPRPADSERVIPRGDLCRSGHGLFVCCTWPFFRFTHRFQSKAF